MGQFNMQVDAELNRKVADLRERLGLGSKAEVVRWAIEQAHQNTSLRARPATWWQTYRSRCLDVPRKPRGNVMSEAAFYKALY